MDGAPALVVAGAFGPVLAGGALVPVSDGAPVSVLCRPLFGFTGGRYVGLGCTPSQCPRPTLMVMAPTVVEPSFMQSSVMVKEVSRVGLWGTSIW